MVETETTEQTVSEENKGINAIPVFGNEKGPSGILITIDCDCATVLDGKVVILLNLDKTEKFALKFQNAVEHVMVHEDPTTIKIIGVSETK